MSDSLLPKFKSKISKFKLLSKLTTLLNVHFLSASGSRTADYNKFSFAQRVSSVDKFMMLHHFVMKTREGKDRK